MTPSGAKRVRKQRMCERPELDRTAEQSNGMSEVRIRESEAR
jgi:hypothetical protein